ncbi:MAG: D-TA family PLP-dependent enzyme [Flavisolibacter sp.]
MKEMNHTLPAWYLIKNLECTDTPFLAVYPERIKKNISKAIEMIGDVERLRPHIKTHKTSEAILLQMEAGIKKFKCATIAEAEMLALAGAPDILLAYQPVGPKADRLISLIEKYSSSRFACILDDKEVAELLSSKASVAGIRVPVYIDLNVGMNRTGISPSMASGFYAHCASLPGIWPVGLHAYDGHISDRDLRERALRCDQVFKVVEDLKNELVKKGFEKPLIVIGGSPGFPVHAKRENVECSPGTFIYWDNGYLQNLPEQAFLPAALVITRIISMPDETTLCTDLGHKSISSENELGKRVFFFNAPELEPVGHSEEHLVLRTTPGHDYAIGDVLYGLPYHICPTCALYEKVLTVEGGTITGSWDVVARNRRLGC